MLVPTFADKGCRVVSATDPYGRILGFLDRRPPLSFTNLPVPTARIVFPLITKDKAFFGFCNLPEK
jgi:hypothetical protein